MTAAGAGVPGAVVVGRIANEGAGVWATKAGAGDEGANPSDGGGIGVAGGATGAAATGGGGKVGTTIPGGGAATARGSSINSTGRSGNCSSKGEPADVPAGAGAAATLGAVALGVAVSEDDAVDTAGADARVVPGGAGDAVAIGFCVAPSAEGVVGGELPVATGIAVCNVVAGADGGRPEAVGIEVRDAVAVLGASAADDTEAEDGPFDPGVGAAFLEGGVLVAPALVGIPTGFDTPASVAPARRLDAALAAAAIFRAVAAAAGFIGAGAGVAGAGPGATVLGADAVGAGALASGRPNVPAPFGPSIRASPPSSETPNRTSGSSSSPAADASNGGISELSGPASGGGTVGLADRSSRSPCESKSSLESAEAPCGDCGETEPMGSSTGRSARGSS